MSGGEKIRRKGQCHYNRGWMERAYKGKAETKPWCEAGLKVKRTEGRWRGRIKRNRVKG